MNRGDGKDAGGEDMGSAGDRGGAGGAGKELAKRGKHIVELRAIG